MNWRRGDGEKGRLGGDWETGRSEEEEYRFE